MGGFKRLCLAIYSLAGFAALAALGLTVVGPWTKRASQLFSYEWYFYTVLGHSRLWSAHFTASCTFFAS